MDSATAKSPQVLPTGDEEAQTTRAVVFPDEDGEIHEEKLHHHLRPKGVEMKREMTKEDKELAAAGYEHLDEHKHKGKDGGKSDFGDVDIHEHQLGFVELGTTLETNFDAKDPAHSHGLTGSEAKARLARDGLNVLTPPKKKSALRKVQCLSFVIESEITFCLTVSRLLIDNVQYSLDRRRHFRICSPRYRLQGTPVTYRCLVSFTHILGSHVLEQLPQYLSRWYSYR